MKKEQPTLFGLVQLWAWPQSLWLPGPWGRSWRHWWRSRQRDASLLCWNYSHTHWSPCNSIRFFCHCFYSNLNLIFFNMIMKETLTRSSCCSSAIGQSPAPSCPPDICCSRLRKSPQSAFSCLTAPWNRPVMCHQQPDCNSKNVSFFSHRKHSSFTSKFIFTLYRSV